MTLGKFCLVSLLFTSLVCQAAHAGAPAGTEDGVGDEKTKLGPPLVRSVRNALARSVLVRRVREALVTIDDVHLRAELEEKAEKQKALEVDVQALKAILQNQTNQIKELSERLEGFLSQNEAVWKHIEDKVTNESRAHDQALETSVQNQKKQTKEMYDQLEGFISQEKAKWNQTEALETSLQNQTNQIKKLSDQLEGFLSEDKAKWKQIDDKVTNETRAAKKIAEQAMAEARLKPTNVTLTNVYQKVAFRADMTHVTNDDYSYTSAIAKFNLVYYNHGGGYNKTTGLFTAPVNGLYIFIARFGTQSECNGKYRGFQIVANGVQIAWARTKCADNMIMTENIVGIAYLLTGQTAYVQALTSAQYVKALWYAASSFSGSLLQADL